MARLGRAQPVVPSFGRGAQYEAATSAVTYTGVTATTVTFTITTAGVFTSASSGSYTVLVTDDEPALAMFPFDS